MDMEEVAQVWRDHKINGDCRYGGSGTIIIMEVVLVRYEYNGSGGVGKMEMVSDSEAHVWRNRQWFNW